MTKKINRVELTSIGGQCPNCGAEDLWEIKDRSKIGGTEFEFHYDLECMGERHLDPEEEGEEGLIQYCGHTKEIDVDESPEYEKELSRDFDDDIT